MSMHLVHGLEQGHILTQQGTHPQSSAVFSLSLAHTVVDIFLHVGNCFNVYGFLQLFNPYAYLPGVCRGCAADDAAQ